MRPFAVLTFVGLLACDSAKLESTETPRPTAATSAASLQIPLATLRSDAGAREARDGDDAGVEPLKSGEIDVGDAGSALISRTHLGRVNVDFRNGPLYFSASFDGSQRFSMWLDTMCFAREIQLQYGKSLRFSYFINSYFINSCFYDHTLRGSLIGKAATHEEALTRRALTQLAINAGHDIGNHGVRHDNGQSWSGERSMAEFAEFHAVTDRSLFEPIVSSGRHVFPQFAEAPAAQPGGACQTDADCSQTKDVFYLELSDEIQVCSTPCNRKKPC